MQLSVLKTRIASELNKGDLADVLQGGMTVEEIIVQCIEQAIVEIELKKTWDWMDRFVTFTLDKDAANPRVLPYPVGCKKIEFIRLTVDGDYQYLNECKPADLAPPSEDVPTQYFKDGVERIFLNNTPLENYSGEMSYAQTTTFSNTDAFEPHVMKYYWPVVMYRALADAYYFFKEFEQQQVAEGMYITKLQDLNKLEDEREYSNQSMSMQY